MQVRWRWKRPDERKRLTVGTEVSSDKVKKLRDKETGKAWRGEHGIKTKTRAEVERYLDRKRVRESMHFLNGEGEKILRSE